MKVSVFTPLALCACLVAASCSGSSSNSSAPAAPGGLAVSGTPTSTSISLAWTAVTGASGYRVYRSSSSGGSYSKVGSDIASGTTYTDSGLSPATTYYYEVSAYNDSGESQKSSPVSGTTASSSGGSHSYADAAPTFSALTAALTAAELSTDSSSSAYYTYDGTTYTFHFNGFTSNGITCNGSLAMNVATGDINGTVTFSGSNVSSIVYHDVNTTSTPKHGTCTITFTDGSTWSYDFGTGVFTST